MKFRLIGQDDFGHGRTLEVTADTEDEARALAMQEGIAVIVVKRLPDDGPSRLQPSAQHEPIQRPWLEARYDVGEALWTRRVALVLFAVVAVGLPAVVVFFAHNGPLLITAMAVSLIFVPLAIAGYRSAQRRIAWRDVVLRLEDTGLRYSPYGRNALHIPWQQILAVKEVIARGSADLFVTYRDENAREAQLRISIGQLDKSSWRQVRPTIERMLHSHRPIDRKDPAETPSKGRVRRVVTQGWFVCFAIATFSLCACLTLAAVELAVKGERFGFENSWRLTACVVLSQPVWIGFAVGGWLVARKLGREGSGALGIGGRVFAGLFAIAAIAAGGYLLCEGYMNPRLGEPNTVGKMQKFGCGAVVVGVLGLVYCVFGGRNPDAPELHLD